MLLITTRTVFVSLMNKVKKLLTKIFTFTPKTINMKFTICINDFLKFNMKAYGGPTEIEVTHWMGTTFNYSGSPAILAQIADWAGLEKHIDAAAKNNWQSSEEYARLMERQITETFTQNNTDEKEEKGQCPDEWYDQRREDLRGVQDEHSNHGTGTSEQGSDRCINSSLY